MATSAVSAAMNESVEFPPSTHEGIQPYVHEDLYEILCSNFSRPEVTQLFGGGVQRESFAMITNIKAKWHRTNNQVDGVVFILSNKTSIQVWFPLSRRQNRQHDRIEIFDYVTHIRETSQQESDIPVCIKVPLCSARTKDPVPQFQFEHIDNQEGIRAFFNQNLSLLPGSIREVLSDGRNEHILSLLSRSE